MSDFYCFRSLDLISGPRAEFHANLDMLTRSGAGSGLLLCCVFGVIGDS